MASQITPVSSPSYLGAEAEYAALRLWAHDIRPDDPSQWATAQTNGQAGAVAVPPGYKVVAFTPTQTILQCEEGTSKHFRTAQQSVAKPLTESAAKIRKPH